jgi:threonine dehydrogenase-like Zn-dependent dehydrogenase
VRALTVAPGVAGSGRLEDIDAPRAAGGELLVEGVALGVCGTDREILAGGYGWAPPGEARLILGHESLGVVVAGPPGAAPGPGDLVAGIVRRPDPVPCAACAAGQWDMCRNGRYTEHGIKELHGFGAERYVLPLDAVVAVPHRLGEAGVLVEPASVVAKAWEHVERIGARAVWSPRRALVTGAGPVGLLAALLAVQRGYEVTVLDVVPDGPKPALVRALGATYVSTSIDDVAEEPDVVIECTGASSVVIDVLTRTARGGIVCLSGMSSGAHHVGIDVAAINRELVLENDVVFGSVNANAGHYRAAVEALAAADLSWLHGLLTRRVPMSRWSEAFDRHPHDVKVVLDLRR